MDTSKEYIKMCEDAKEIQNSHEPKEGDFWCCSCGSCQENENLAIHNMTDYEIDYVNNRDLTKVDKTYANMVRMADNCFGGFWATRNQEKDRGYTWLPRQDQLQEIYDLPINISIHYSTDHYMIFRGEEDEPDEHIISMYWERFWLVFVMKEKYKKIWNGEKWNEVD